MARHPDVQYIRFYTSGSAAQVVAPVRPMDTMKLPKVRKKKRLVIPVDPMAILGIGLAALMSVLMIVGVVRLENAKADVAAMTAYVEVLKEENARLNATYESGYDLVDIEKTALALGMVPAEETQIIKVHMEQKSAAPEQGVWERFYMFLTGLFA